MSSSSQEASSTTSTPMSITITITVPLTEAQTFFAHLAESMNKTSSPQDKVGVMKQGLSTGSRIANSTSQISPIPTSKTSEEPLSDKQRGLIHSTIKRKKLADQQVDLLLQQQFGFKDSSRLTKRQASRLIDILVAM